MGYIGNDPGLSPSKDFAVPLADVRCHGGRRKDGDGRRDKVVT